MENSGQRAFINILYIMLTAVTVFACTPSIPMQIASFCLALLFLTCAYVYRASDRHDGLVYNHMTYMIGTFWASSAILAVSSLIAGFFVYTGGDNSALEDAVQTLQSGNLDVNTFVKSAMDSYKKDNETLLIISSFITLAPTVLYFVYRVANGYSRAMKGYRIANPKSWL